MKGNKILSVPGLLFFAFMMVSCDAFSILHATDTPTPVEITSTQTPSATPTIKPSVQPSPTIQLTRWDVLLPENINLCKEINRFSQFNPEEPDLLREELLILSGKEKAILETEYIDGLLTLDLNKIEFDFGDDPSQSRRPDLIVINEWNPIFTSCSYLPYKEGDGLFILGMRIRRTEDQQHAIIHLAMDDAGLKSLITEGGLKPSQYEIENYYKNLADKRIIGSLIAIVTKQGKSTMDGPWKKSLELLNFPYVETGQNFSELLMRYFNTEKILTTDEIHEIQSILEEFLIPCFGLSLHF